MILFSFFSPFFSPSLSLSLIAYREKFSFSLFLLFLSSLPLSLFLIRTKRSVQGNREIAEPETGNDREVGDGTNDGMHDGLSRCVEGRGRNHKEEIDKDKGMCM